MVFATEKNVLPQLFYHEMWYKYTTITAVILFAMGYSRIDRIIVLSHGYQPTALRETTLCI